MALSARNEVFVKLKDELDSALKLVQVVRKALEDEISSDWDRGIKKLHIDREFLTKLKELTSSFNSLTESKIRLDKAEKQIEKDMTPDEEREAVRRYLMDMGYGELRMFVAAVKAAKEERGDKYIH